jgi:hypothetical protein
MDSYRRNQIEPDLGRSHLGRLLVLVAVPDGRPLVSSFRTATRSTRRAGGPRCSPPSRTWFCAPPTPTRPGSLGRGARPFRGRGQSVRWTNVEASGRHHLGAGACRRARSMPTPGDTADLGDGETITVDAERRLPPGAAMTTNFRAGAAAGLRHRHRAARIHARQLRARSCCQATAPRAWPRPSSTR